jgi:IclR family transcriptional regulator, KDG regulon repressor
MQPATSIVKVCRVLDSFRNCPSMGVTELAQRTGLLRSDAHRILTSLEAFGYIEQDAHTRKYRLGLEILKLGQVVLQRLEIRDVGRHPLRALSEKMEATANLAIFDPRDLEIIFVEQIDSPSEVQLKARIGSRASPHATAVGKVLTAYLDARTARQLLKKEGMPKKTEHTITDASRLEKELEAVRAQGYAVDREEAVEGACCIGAPVRDHTGAVAAALSVSMMAGRFYRCPEAQLAAIVRAAAARFSAALGYQSADRGRSRAI